jgi:DNA-binding response OmpR family regulator
MKPKVLLITDRADLARLLAEMLIHTGIEVTLLNHTIAKSMTGTESIEDYDLLLLNMFDEERHSIEICQKLRDRFFNPILVLLYDSDERFLLRAYEAGADDCLVQPMSIHLLLAKIQAWMLRSGVTDKSIGLLEVYNFRFNPVKSEVITPEDILVRLSQLEARLLHLLMVYNGQIVATDMIIQRVWPDSGVTDGDRHLLKALVHRLRRKIESDPIHPRYIHTIPHQGYTFRQENNDLLPFTRGDDQSGA